MKGFVEMTLLKKIKITSSTGLLFMVLCSTVVFGQEPEARRHFKDDSTRAEFYILLESKRIRYRKAHTYYWFHAQKLHCTQEGAAGKLLHGPFTRFYHEGQLAEKGDFRYGLKHGNWKFWYPSGILASEYHYKKGMLHGSYTLFDSSGEVLDYGKFRRGVKHSKKEKREKRATKKLEKKNNEIETDSLKSVTEVDTTLFERVKNSLKPDPDKRLARQQKREERRLEKQRKKEANEN